MIDTRLNKLLLGNGEQLAYRERDGGEQAIILIHGNMTSSVHWDRVMNRLADKYKVYAPDLRGFGHSSYHEPISSIKEFSDDLKMFVDQLGLNDFILVGWSLGGAVCQQFVVDYPGYCKKLFLLASASTRGYPIFATGEEGLPIPSKRLHTLEEITSDSKTKMIQAAYHSKNYQLLKDIWNMLIYTENQPEEKTYEKYLDEMVLQRNLADTYYALNMFNLSPVHNGVVTGEDKIKNIHIPVMIAWGKNDLVVTKEMTNELVEDYGKEAIYYELKNCGHSPQTDDLDQLLQVMEQFFEQ